MAPLEADPYTVSNIREIDVILQRLTRERVLLRMDIPGQVTSIISVLLGFASKSDEIVFDGAQDTSVGGQLTDAGSVRVQGMLDHIKIEFSGALRAILLDGQPTFAMAKPKSLRRMQRRQFYRVEVPVTRPAVCIVQAESPPETDANFRIVDISAGGLKLADDDASMAAVPIETVFHNCTLILPDIGRVMIHMRLLRTSSRSNENGQPMRRAAFCYVDLPGEKQRAIQRYVDAVERGTIAKLRKPDD